MDLTSLLSSMLSDDSLTAVAQKAGVSEDAAAGVLASALPSLLNGANGQASGKDTADSFQEAVLAHAGRNPMDVDLDEGKKIVGHLLGTQNNTQQEIAERSGLNSSQVGLILAAAAPLLMNMLGSNSSSNTSAGTASLLASLLGGSSNSASSNSFMTSALSSVLTGAMGSNSGSNNLLGSLLGSALGGQTNHKPQNQNNMAGSIIGSLLGGQTNNKPQNNMAGSILGSLLGGQTNNKPQSGNQSSGLNLGSILSSLLK